MVRPAGYFTQGSQLRCPPVPSTPSALLSHRPSPLTAGTWQSCEALGAKPNRTKASEPALQPQPRGQCPALCHRLSLKEKVSMHAEKHLSESSSHECFTNPSTKSPMASQEVSFPRGWVPALVCFLLSAGLGSFSLCATQPGLPWAGSTREATFHHNHESSV